MPPRGFAPDLSPLQNGECQRLMSSSDPGEGDSDQQDDPTIIQRHLQPHQQPASFWESIRKRREESDQLAAENSERRQRNRCTAVCLGQLIAFVAASVNVTSFTLENNFQVVAPTSQLFVMYIFLSLHLLFRSRDYRPSDPVYRMPLLGFRLHLPFYLYLFFSLIDVGAGLIMLFSLQYTSLTSVTLLGSLTVPSTMLFSKFLLDKSFHFHHFLGVCLCLVGGCLTLWSDLGDSDDVDASNATNSTNTTTTASQNPIMNGGDLMAISAALLYGLGDAVSEYSIKHVDRMEFLGMLGFFGILLTGIQFPFLEGDVLKELFSDPSANRNAFMLMGSYITLLLLYYVTEAYFLISSDATLLNLSLQAQNLWAILFSVLTHQAAPPGLFYLAVVFVFTGVAAYEVGTSSDPVIQILSTCNEHCVQQQGEDEDSAVSVITSGSDKNRKQGGARYNSIQTIEII